MIKRLRNRFIRIATLSVAAVMLLLTAILNVANYISTDADLRSTLTLIYENQGTIPISGSMDAIPEPSGDDVPPPTPPQGKPDGRDGHFTPETPVSTRYFVLRYDADGTLTDEDGQTYRYLYWEGVTDQVYDFSSGFCVAGSDTAAFLEDALEQLGLSRAEANEFIIYWLPRMQENAYNLIAFQHEAYTESARLTITPEPDTLIRVFMAYRPLEKAVEIAPQTLTAPERTGFTAVEWGGAECK